MARFNPAASPSDAVRQGLYVPPAGRSTADEVAARLELDPTSSHLIVGGIGSGKTTQLLVAGERLHQLSDTYVEYVDVSKYHDLSHMNPGTLVVIAGLVLGKACKGEVGSATVAAKHRIHRWAYGHREWVEVDEREDWELDDHDDVYVPHRLVEQAPMLSSPDQPLAWSVAEKAEALSALSAELTKKYPHLVLLVDSLDRMSDPAAFTTVVEQDVRAINRAGIGVALIGPLASMYGSHRSVTDHFQHFYPQLSIDPQDERGLDFMIDLLRKRAKDEMLTEGARRRLAELSGGVLRDLVSLARGAGEDAYLRNADIVDLEHVETAADAFGRQLLFGLGSTEIASLQRLRKKKVFVQTSDEDVALLVTRRVLEYRNGRSRFAVHPTIELLLAQLDDETGAP
jgi:Cdc6-like AAA superfamily ATPase